MPKVTVVLPVFNAADTIVRAVNSILQQSLSDLELLVVDDGSTDSTADVLRRIRDPRLKLLSTPHAGVALAANVGTREAQAELIARMDSDDFSHPERLEAQLRLLRDESLDVVGCKVQILNRDRTPTSTLQRYQRWINEETLTSEQIHALRFVEFPIVNPTILARREYFELGFRNDEYPEDYDLMLRAAALGMKFGKVADVLFDWFDTKRRLTRYDPRYSDAAFMDCRQSHLREGPLKNVVFADVWGVGKTGKPWLQWLQSEAITVRRAYDVNPRKIGKLIHHVPVHHADAMPRADDVPLIIAVGADGARKLIEEFIRPLGYIPGQNAWFVA